MIDEPIKTGRTGKQPRIKTVVWKGTAEVICYECARVPAALVETDRGEMAIVQLRGTKDFEKNRWWDARCIFSREWEMPNGIQVAEAHPELTKRIDDFLKTATRDHEMANKELNNRVRGGRYRLATEESEAP